MIHCGLNQSPSAVGWFTSRGIDERRLGRDSLLSYQFGVADSDKRLRAGPSHNEYVSMLCRQGVVGIRSLTMDVSVRQHPDKDSGVQVRGIDHADTTRSVIEIL